MNKLQKKVATAIATGALIFNSLAVPAFADVTVVISGNGSDSDNDATVDVDQSTTVVQENQANISNDVDATADTGNNDANDNTGGDVTIETGDADVDVEVTNSVNSNTASVNCCNGDIDVLIEGNGSDSDNDVDVDVDTTTSVFQENKAYIKNDIDADADTGNNDANDNTGGDVTIETGDAGVDVEVTNSANANWARVSGNDGGTSLSARILGNGSDSDNDIKIDFDRSVVVTQENQANIENYVDADADTGNNDANDNTGGDVSIETGDADVDVTIDNLVNFNWADVNCGCFLDVFAKIAGNGSDSDNDIDVDIDDTLIVFQENSCKKSWGGWWRRSKKPCLDNHVHADADTGGNDAEDNTGAPDGDPSIETGDADVDVTIDNSGNVNVFGEEPELELPDFLGGFSINISLNLSALLAMLGLA